MISSSSEIQMFFAKLYDGTDYIWELGQPVLICSENDPTWQLGELISWTDDNQLQVLFFFCFGGRGKVQDEAKKKSISTSKKKKFKGTRYNWESGTIVEFYHSENERWYKARIVQVIEYEKKEPVAKKEKEDNTYIANALEPNRHTLIPIRKDHESVHKDCSYVISLNIWTNNDQTSMTCIVPRLSNRLRHCIKNLVGEYSSSKIVPVLSSLEPLRNGLFSPEESQSPTGAPKHSLTTITAFDQQLTLLLQYWLRTCKDGVQKNMPSELMRDIIRYYNFGDVVVISDRQLQIINAIGDVVDKDNGMVLQVELPLLQQFFHRSSYVRSWSQNDSLFFIGGYDPTQSRPVCNVSQFHIFTRTFTTLPQLNFRRYDSKSLMLDHNIVVTLGGYDTYSIDKCEMLDLSVKNQVDNKWKVLPDLPTNLAEFAAGTTHYRMFVAGGTNTYTIKNTCFMLDFTQLQQYSDISSPLSTNASKRNKSLSSHCKDWCFADQANSLVASQIQEQDKKGWIALPSMLYPRYRCNGVYTYIVVLFHLNNWKGHSIVHFQKKKKKKKKKGFVWNDEYFMVLGGKCFVRGMEGLNFRRLEWKTFPSSTYDHSNGVIGIWNNHIVWAGDDRELNNVECFDFRDQQWHLIQVCPQKCVSSRDKIRMWGWS
ncbi:hypothetical protein RFI_12144 [Reticulomyxa filosa]|uniref:Uncharacterized protein n=1 Tax=Reticulomyxa filosa TaxID=46433 RepID=X6NG94_RETFI|nr:hypothetical protein RFI_12144 [Reticulomyxa filosa]|eukprot:ETO25001.1 hypothetical protein RFI_12144 [Reticulomyxa filosa]